MSRTIYIEFKVFWLHCHAFKHRATYHACAKAARCPQFMHRIGTSAGIRAVCINVLVVGTGIVPENFVAMSALHYRGAL